MASEQFSLCWDNFHKNMSSGMNSLLEHEDLVDVTLAIEGRLLKAHKMVLSVCSPYFKELFKSNPCQHPIVFMKDVSYIAMSDLLQFMYQGEVQVSQDNLTTFIKTAEALQIKGLTGDGNGSTDADGESVQEKPASRHIEESYKPMPRPKKQTLAPAVSSSPSPSTKRPRLSSNDSQSTLTPITKTEPAVAQSIKPDTSAVQFKVEPYEQNQSTLTDDDGGENMDDMLDDSTVDGAEDYSMMEGEEPQAGTSADGTGEGQERIHFRVTKKNPIMIRNKFEYRLKKPYEHKTLWICTKQKQFKCKARIYSTRNTLIIRESTHTHSATFGGATHPLKSQLVKVVDASEMMVHFYHGRKYPILILGQFQYRVETRTREKSMWCCREKDKHRCKARLLSFGKTLIVKTSVAHNHQPTLGDDLGSCVPQMLQVRFSENLYGAFKSLNVSTCQDPAKMTDAESEERRHLGFP